MNGYVMTVRFSKTADPRRCVVTAWAHDRRLFPVSGMGATERIPHDLATFVVEQRLGLAGGFFNLTAHHATFRSSGRRPTRPGRAVIAANRLELDGAERAVHAHEDAWRSGAATPVAEALTQAEQRWRRLAPGDHFELAWRRLPLPVRVPRRRPRGAARRRVPG
jgi:hypothetical protein